MVGNVPIGSEHPVVVQSMINEDTLDIEAAVAGIIRWPRRATDRARDHTLHGPRQSDAGDPGSRPIPWLRGSTRR